MEGKVYKFYAVVLVEWVDSRQPTSRWTHLEDWEPDGICTCQSVGFLILKNEEITVIASNMGDPGTDDAQASGIIHIPNCSIKRMDYLARQWNAPSRDSEPISPRPDGGHGVGGKTLL